MVSAFPESLNDKSADVRCGAQGTFAVRGIETPLRTLQEVALSSQRDLPFSKNRAFSFIDMADPDRDDRCEADSLFRAPISEDYQLRHLLRPAASPVFPLSIHLFEAWKPEPARPGR